MGEYEIIAAVRDENALDRAVQIKPERAFLLFGNLVQSPSHVKRLREVGTEVFVHLDMIEGLKSDSEGLRYVAHRMKPCGIITTKPSLIRHCKQYSLHSILRIFMIDSAALESGAHSVAACEPDFVEIMPGIAYDAITKFRRLTDTPLVAGGMITTSAQAKTAIISGAVAVSSSNEKLWSL